MKKRFLITVAAASACIITAASAASAQQIVFTGEKCPLPIAAAVGAETVVAEVESMNALGVQGEYVAVLLKQSDVIAAETVVEEGAEQAAEATAEAGAEQAVDATGGEQAVDGAADAGADQAADGAAEEGADQAAVEEAPAPEPCCVRFVPVDAFAEYIPGFDLTALPNAEGVPTYTRGNENDVIFALQDDMVRMGYLAGPADGKFGPNTEGAFMRIKGENGMPQDGVVDAVPQSLVMELEDIATGTASPAVELPYPPVFVPEEKFAAIYDQTDADLTPFLTPDWKFSYDVFEGTGAINNGTTLGTLSLGEKKIDRLELNAGLRVATIRDEKGYVKVVPVIHVDTLGAYCPYIQTAQIKVGNKVETAELLGSKRAVQGVDVCEADDLELTAAAVELLGTEGQIVVRLNGVNSEYDITVDQSTVAGFAAAVQGLGQE